MKHMTKYFAILVACMALPAMAGFNPQWVKLECKLKHEPDAAYRHRTYVSDIWSGSEYLKPDIDFRFTFSEHKGKFTKVKLEIHDDLPEYPGDTVFYTTMTEAAVYPATFFHIEDYHMIHMTQFKVGASVPVTAKFLNDDGKEHPLPGYCVLVKGDNRALSIDWNSHPGADVVLNNGAFNDYFVSHETGDWSRISLESGSVWRLKGANNGSEPIANRYDDFDENFSVDNVGECQVACNYFLDDDSVISAGYSFEVAKELDVKLVSKTTDKAAIPNTYFEMFGLGNRIQPELVWEWSTTATESILVAETETTQVSVGTYAESTVGTKSTASGKVDAKVKSAEFSSELSQELKTGITSEMSSSHSVTLEREFERSISLSAPTITVKRGKIAYWCTELVANRYDFVADYYIDKLPRDGFPDGPKNTVNITVYDASSISMNQFPSEKDDPGYTNMAPVANNQTLLMKYNTIKLITLSATDLENDVLTYAVVSQPTNGTLSGIAPNLVYTPNDGFVGSDSFTFKANDGRSDSNIATVSIVVTDRVIE